MQQLQALSADDLELRFQPILLVNAPGHIALELLLRFRPLPLARLGTEAVLRLAHELAIAHRIDRLVLQRLGDVQQAWRELGPLAVRIQSINVNISAASLATTARQDALITLLRGQRATAGLFCLELTETTAMGGAVGLEDIRNASQRLVEELNLRLVVDDFGAGLANYRRLCEASYDGIKLDRQLVCGMAGSFRLQTLVGSLIEVLHGFGKTVVAEGVEQQRDLEALLRLGVDGVQGLLIAPPLPWAELTPFLLESPWLESSCIPALQEATGRQEPQLHTSLPPAAAGPILPPASLERYVLEHWSSLRSFEEVVLRYVQELRSWGLDVLRLSLAFLPDQEEVDCSQYIWYRDRPAEVQALRMQRDFLQTQQHRQSVLHHLATRCRSYRLVLADGVASGFAFLEELQALGGTDYLGLRLPSRGVSIPVLSICLAGPRRFSAQQLERIEAMSGLLSLLFHAFECERASRLSLHDPLTHLPNRRSFDSRIRAEGVAAVTNGTPMAVLMLDIDRFKLINDTLGHAYGDVCLAKVASLLQQQLQRQNDMVARLGGEEFGVILANTDGARALAVAERLRQAVAVASIRHPAPTNGRGLTISIGLATWTPQAGDGLAVEALLQLADTCLYQAKHQGRDRVVAAQLRAGRVPSLVP